jgi:T4 bacteriophage base plate protein
MMTIPIVKVPTFKMTLPFSKKEVTYRPYVVKEEKLLIMANESDDALAMIDAICDVVANCTFGEITPSKDPMFDVQYAFLQIRGKSQGEELEFYSVCGIEECGHQTPVKMKVSDFTLKLTPGHTNRIELENSVNVVMNYPTLNLYNALYETKDEEAIYDIVAQCIDTIYTGDETFVNDATEFSEFRNFIDNLTPAQFEKFEQFFVSMPVLIFTFTYDCDKCQKQNTLTIDGITNFFE